jgi:hypothetical protein
MLLTFDPTEQYRICQWPHSCLRICLQGKLLIVYSRLASSQTYNKPLCSTVTAVLRVLSDILQAVDEGDYVAVLTILNLSAAFDTVDLCILLQRLQITFGFDGPHNSGTGRISMVGRRLSAEDSSSKLLPLSAAAFYRDQFSDQPCLSCTHQT